MRRFDPVEYELYVITDTGLARGRPLGELVAQAIDGGATIIQYREKLTDDRMRYENARILRELTRSRRIPFIVNDRLDLALAIDADGIHLGQEDMPPEVARRLLGRARIVGLSTHGEDQARAAARVSPDYIAIGPIFPTRTKKAALPPLGTEIIARLRPELSIPVVAIGGIDRTNAALAARAGADGVAVISAVMGAEDVMGAARDLRAAFREGKVQAKERS
jgi:thiamine-phosphate pyrophosphorylase